jgi:hypothetical protein
MRQLKISEADVVYVLTNPDFEDADHDGRRRCSAELRGSRVRVVLAVDDPEFVVSVHRRGRGAS